MSSKPTWVRGERLSELETLPTAQNLVSFKDYMHFIGPTSDEVSFCTEGKKKKKNQTENNFAWPFKTPVSLRAVGCILQ